MPKYFVRDTITLHRVYKVEAPTADAALELARSGEIFLMDDEESELVREEEISNTPWELVADPEELELEVDNIPDINEGNGPTVWDEETGRPE